MFQAVDEQYKIGVFFQEIDRVISLLQSELDLLKLQKQTLLSIMFAKEGEAVPKIRFNGFNDEWEEHKLGELATLGSSKRIHLKDYVSKGIPFYQGGEISNGGVVTFLLPR